MLGALRGTLLDMSNTFTWYRVLIYRYGIDRVRREAIKCNFIAANSYKAKDMSMCDNVDDVEPNLIL